jgi:uncharacterized protein (DUF1697 family)
MRYVALLRAVNVGGRQMKMDRLRVALEEIKLRNVETFIASGNALFDSTASAASLEGKIEKHLAKTFGFEVPTMLRSAEEMRAAATYDAFPKLAPPAGKGGLYVGFLKSAPAAEHVKTMQALCDELNEFRVRGREVYWLTRDRTEVLKISGATFEKALRTPATFRNVTTVRKLAAKCPA